YFRRALARGAGQDQVADLRRAVTLAPAELRYQYHLGLALHRAGDLAAAVQRYRTVLQRDAAWPGAGIALALATLEQDPQADLAALPGSTPAVRGALAPVQALLQGTMPASRGDEPLERLWRGLGLVRAGDAAAREALIQAVDRPAHAAAATGDWAQATALWERARQVASSGTGLGSPRPLLHNLALAYEAQERWLEAAEAWRAMLRTRPRRRSQSTKVQATEHATGRAAAGEGHPQPAEPAAAGGGLSEARWAW